MGPELERVRDHLANERTFLAWVRTAIGVVVFGFAIGRFGLALHELAAAQGRRIATTGLSMWFGTASMLFGVFVLFGGWIRFRRTQRMLSEGRYEPSHHLLAVITAVAAALGLGLVWYLLAVRQVVP